MRTANVRTIVIRTLVALVGAAGWSVLALARGEDVSAAWMVAAALGSYAIGYRFCSKVIAYKVLKVDATRATPAGRLNDGIDFHPTDRRVLLGHHFAAIAGAEPRAGDHPQAPVPTRRAFERMGTERQEGDPRKGFRCC
ncbi:CstA-like transporter-associated (seleno)protein [Streptomyces canus]